MNICIRDLEVLRSQLEDVYDQLEKDIHKLYVSNKEKDALLKEKVQTLIDRQITYIDGIISNLLNTPRMYEKLMELNREYKELVGEACGKK